MPGGTFCPHCGSARTTPEQKFCQNCGKPLTPVTAPPPAAPPAPQATTPRANVSQKPVKAAGKSVPALEVWLAEVKRTVVTEARSSGNIYTSSLDSRPEVTITKVAPSLDVMNYPAISTVSTAGGSLFNPGAPKTFTQTERMAVILDASGKTMYYLFAPGENQDPPSAGIMQLNQAILMNTGNAPVNMTTMPVNGARVQEGDHIKNYRQIPLLIQRDYAALFSSVPLTLNAKAQVSTPGVGITGSLMMGIGGAIGNAMAGAMGMDTKLDPNVPRPFDPVADISTQRDKLTKILSSGGQATSQVAYKQRMCSACGTVLIFDPNENALFCPHCNQYTQRYDSPPRYRRALAEIVSMEKMQPLTNAFSFGGMGAYSAFLTPQDIEIKKRSAFCPVCSAWLQFVHIPPDFNHPVEGLGRHVWFCPHCISVCDSITDRPINVPHAVSCSICGSTDPSLGQSGTTVCPSCHSTFVTAEWESKSPMPSSETNEPPWSHYLGIYPQNFAYTLASPRQSR